MSVCSINSTVVENDAQNIINTYKLDTPVNVKNENAQTVYGQYKEGLDKLQEKLYTLENYIKGGCTSNTTALTSMGILQDEILRLKNDIAEKTHDVDVAKSRHDSIINGNKHTSSYEGLGAKMGFINPLHKSSISILIGLAIFIMLVSVYVANILFSAGAVAGPMNTANLLTSLDKRAFLMGVGFVGIIVGIASLLGLYGKSVQ